MRAAAGAILDEIPHVHSVIIEGGGDLAESWQRAAAHRGIHLRIVHAHDWRKMFLYERERRDGSSFHRHAIGDAGRRGGRASPIPGRRGV